MGKLLPLCVTVPCIHFIEFKYSCNVSLTVQVKQEQMRPRYHTCLRLLLGGQDTLEVLLKEDCSLLCIRGEMNRVHNHQGQICLLHSGKNRKQPQLLTWNNSYDHNSILFLTLTQQI